MSATPFFNGIEAALRPLADAQRAAAMSAYLQNQFLFLGLAAPVRRQAVKALVVQPISSEAELLGLAFALWRQPEREYRYTAIDLLRHHHKLLGLHALPRLQQLLLESPWWETVDGLSAVVGLVLRRARAGVDDPQTFMDAWLVHPSFWVRRCAMIHQLGWRLDTDTERLLRYALQLADEKEFFIRKAIGWALRDYARWNPALVRAFLSQEGARLSALSQREASKHL